MRLQKGEIYIYEGGELIPFDPLTYQYNGFTLPKLYDLYLDRKKLLSNLKVYRDKLLKESPHLSGDTLYDVLDALFNKDNIEIINKNDRYYVFDTEDGYIQKVAHGSHVTKDIELPSDIESGNYYIDNGKIIKDINKEAESWYQTL